jgi:pyruvate,water dikinase
MVGFADLRDQLVRLAGEAVRDGRLPSVEHLWLLDVDEARRLDGGWRPDEAFWAARLAEVERLARLDPPPVVHRFDDPAGWSGAPAPDGDRFHGLPLTDGVVRGRAWVLREPSLVLPDGFTPQSTVLVARSVDAGWIPTFALVAGVVVETGGDLSHGSILLRERGVPAVTNVRGVTRALATGEPVELRAGAGVVERLAGERVASRA